MGMAWALNSVNPTKAHKLASLSTFLDFKIEIGSFYLHYQTNCVKPNAISTLSINKEYIKMENNDVCFQKKKCTTYKMGLNYRQIN